MEVAREKLTPKQEKALAALLARGEGKAAAKDAGVGETTLWRWLKDSAFAEAYRAARCKLLEAGAASLTANVAKAAKVLVDIAESKDAPASARVAAARAIIEGAHKTVETLDLLPRVAELEKFLEDKKGRKR